MIRNIRGTAPTVCPSEKAFNQVSAPACELPEVASGAVSAAALASRAAISTQDLDTSSWLTRITKRVSVPVRARGLVGPYPGRRAWQWWFVLAGMILAVVGAVLALIGFSRTWKDFRSDQKFSGVLISWVSAG